MLQRACYDTALREWRWLDHDTATMGSLEVQPVFNVPYAFRDEVSRVTGVRMPSDMDPQYPYGQAEMEAPLSRSSRISRPSGGEPMSYGTGTRRLQGSPSEKQQHLPLFHPNLSPATRKALRDALDQ